MSYIGPMYFLYKQVFFSFTKLDFTQYHLHDKNKMCFMKLWSKYSFYKRLFPVFSKMYRSALQYMNKHNIYTICCSELNQMQFFEHQNFQTRGQPPFEI